MNSLRSALLLTAVLAVAAPAGLRGQTARVLTLEPLLTVPLLRDQRGWGGPGLRLAYREPQTVAVDAGLELAYVNPGERQEVVTSTGAGGVSVIRTRRDEIRYGYLALAGRHHVPASARLHGVLTASVGLYRLRRRISVEERTGPGTPIRPARVLRDETLVRPGVGAGVGALWSIGAGFRIEAAVRLHAAGGDGFAVHDAFPALLLSMGLSRVLGGRTR